MMILGGSMKIYNLYNGLSRYSISTIFNEFMFNSNPDTIFLADGAYSIYPLGIKDGVILQNHLSEYIFEQVYSK